MAEVDLNDVKQLADRLTAPETVSVTFAGFTIEARPANVAVMKRLRRATAQLQKYINDSGTTEELLANPDKQADRDEKIADLFIEAAKAILEEQYKHVISKDELEKRASLSEVEAFLNLQMRLNREDDFLSRALRGYLGIWSMTPAETTSVTPPPSL